MRLCALAVKKVCTFALTMDKKQQRYDQAYMRMASEWAKLSHCKRKQVGALIVKDRMIISDGFWNFGGKGWFSFQGKSCGGDESF